MLISPTKIVISPAVRALKCALKRTKAKAENEVAQGGSNEERRRTRSDDKATADRRDRNRIAQNKRRANVCTETERRK